MFASTPVSTSTMKPSHLLPEYQFTKAQTDVLIESSSRAGQRTVRELERHPEIEYYDTAGSCSKQI